MIEHRLIERMVALLQQEVQRLGEGRKPRTRLLRAMVEFYATYADRNHHGKEEDILFGEMKEKELSEEHRQMIAELTEDHRVSRRNMDAIAAALDEYEGGREGAAAGLTEPLRQLAERYPKHIQKEDKHLFVPAMEYFSEAELDAMLERFGELQKQLFHDRYEELVAEFEGPARE